MSIPDPVRVGEGARRQRQFWLRRAALVGAWAFAFAFGLIVGLPALSLARGAVEARVDIERGVGRLYGHGLRRPGGPVLDDRTGLPWYPIAGCVVTPTIEMRTRGYNSVMRNAVDRGEVVTRTHQLRSRPDAEAAFEEASEALPEAGLLRLSETVSVENTGSGYLLRVIDDGRTRLRTLYDVYGDCDAALDPTGDVVYVRMSWTGGCPSNGPPQTSVRYLTYDARTGECLQRIDP